jgi:hypothetical protein
MNCVLQSVSVLAPLWSELTSVFVGRRLKPTGIMAFPAVVVLVGSGAML